MFFTEVAVVVAFAAILGMVMIWLRQPSILGYIVAGFLLSLTGYLTSASHQTIETLASFGIAFLLFLVGLEMNLNKIRHLGKHIIYIALIQGLITISVGFFLLQFLGWSSMASAYLSLALSFSSTIITVKFLTEKKDMSSSYGQIVLGVMLLEDFMAIIALVLLSSLNVLNPSVSIGWTVAITLLKGIGLLLATLLIAPYMPKLLQKIDKPAENIFLFSIAWGIGIAALFASKWIGLGIEAGGFLAGLAFARSAEHYEISSKIRWLRDFFIVLFFVLLGSKMVLSQGVYPILGEIITTSLFVSIFTPLVTILALIKLGYDARTSFFAGLMTGQISEFSMVVAAKGLEAGYLSAIDVSFVTIVGIITIVVSSFCITHVELLFHLFKKPLSKLAKKQTISLDPSLEPMLKNHIILIGAHRLGQGVLSALKDANQVVCVIDSDKNNYRKIVDRGFLAINGDGADEEVLLLASVNEARVVISTLPLAEDNAVILKLAKELNPLVKVLVTANSEWEGRDLYSLGADCVIMPHFLTGEHLGEVLRKENWYEEMSILKEKTENILSL